VGETSKPKKPKQPFRLQEHVEWIAVAFVLALTVRCFVVEAYQIPTGSMAPTLYGKHYAVKCPDCGAKFAVGKPEWMKSLPPLVCPQCGREARPGRVKVSEAGGDRILVSKNLYGFVRPRRWDVFVFKDPEPGKENTNYVKRLAGLPGEHIELRDGQVFIDGRMARKPARVQRVMWQDVYSWNASTAPEDYWDPSGDWQVRSQGLLLPQGPSGWQKVEYSRPILDFYAYNGSAGLNVVGDLEVSGHAKLEEESGRFAAAVWADSDTVKAVFIPAAQSLTVELRINQELVARKSAAQASPREFDFSLAWADGAAAVTVNGDEVIRHAREIESGEVPLYTRASGVFFEGASSPQLISNVEVKRDVYYRADMQRPDRFALGPFVETVPPGNYFALGDNSPVSNDSRVWKFVPAGNVLGKAFFVFWPLDRVRPVY